MYSVLGCGGGKRKEAAETNSRFMAHVDINLLNQKKTRFVEFHGQLKLSYADVTSEPRTSVASKNKGLFFAVPFEHKGQLHFHSISSLLWDPV